MRVLDLFCGMGGLSVGFKHAGFEVHGFDENPHALATYGANVGTATRMDLGAVLPSGEASCIVGGPPCRPWSPINVKRRGAKHDDYELVRVFDRTVLQNRPQVFVLENVPLLQFDAKYQDLLLALAAEYDVTERVVTYSEWGAASRRRRLFAVGLRSDLGVKAQSLLDGLDRRKREALTVRQAIGRYAALAPDSVPDHEWPDLKTIDKYADKYRTHQYGWYQLEWDETAPSFGHVAKTYTLHPDSRNGSGSRVVSPREVMALLGFEDSFKFPDSVPRTAKYGMVADAVSPTFSRALADAIAEVLR